MRLCFVISAFSDSTFSLVKALLSAGHDVDTYYCSHQEGSFMSSAFEVTTNTKRTLGEIQELNQFNSRGVSFIDSYPNSHIYLVRTFKTGDRSQGIKQKVIRRVFAYYYKKIAKIIANKHYDYIDIISQSYPIIQLYKYIPKANVLFSFHEVLNTHLKNGMVIPVIKTLLEDGYTIRVFSKKSKLDITSRMNIDDSQIHVVPFGLYTSYLEFGNITMPEIEDFDNYILQYGFIEPYKGLSVLYDSLRILEERGIKINVVVAGRGHDSILEKMSNKDNFRLINRFLSSDELAYLIQNSKFIVCPYLSSSQSGIPQTVFVFKKPIIATRVGTFEELIKNPLMGCLINPNDSKGLAEAIEELYTNAHLYNECVANIDAFESGESKCGWDRIICKYQRCLSTIKHNK